MEFSQKTVAIIGGGAAGFFAAIACAEALPEARVILIEKSAKPLAKVRVSGGGRCNVTHHCFEPSELVTRYPRGHRELRGPFHRFQPQDTVDWFSRHGVELKTECDGRMFPVTDDSETIVSCLMEAAEEAGVELWTQCAVENICAEGGTYVLALAQRDDLRADALLLATGGTRGGHALAEDLGHSIVPTVPSLFTFNIPDSPLLDLAGVAVESATVALPTAKLSETGPLLLTHWGFSGPAILKLSAWGARHLHDCAYRTSVHINWLGDMTVDACADALRHYQAEHTRRQMETICPFNLPKRLWQRLIEVAGLTPTKRWYLESQPNLRRLAQRLTDDVYRISGKTTYKEEFVTCGGIALKEVDLRTMQSKLHPGLFFAGEILDIDGVTGGFNFQNAWTSGWVAGHAIADSLL